MRIQHNIAAMNSYRNYTGNNNALAKNLEKLSSGYKINRAGDDAAGLAISEKMRAQIAGLSQAQSNVKDGISLVKTAEGALQEVQDMMNRMVTLATQSANGTYQNEVDRENLQAEVEELKKEINRIADSSNYNGQKLLNGELGGGTTSTKTLIADLSKIGVDLDVNAKDVTATKGKYTTNALFGDLSQELTNGAANGDSITFTINFTDGEGKAQTKDYTLKVGMSQDGTTTAGALYLDDGSENGIFLTDLDTGATILAEDVANAIDKLADKDATLKTAFDVTVGDNAGGSDGLTFEARQRGSEGAVLNSIQLSFNDKDATGATPAPVYNVEIKETVKAEDSYKAIDLSKAKVFDLDAADGSATSTKNINDAIFEVNGEKFVFIQNGKENDVDVQKALREAGVTHWVAVGTANSVKNTDIDDMVNKIATATGLKVEQGKAAVSANGTMDWTAGAGNAADTYIIFRTSESTKSTVGGGLTLQIGDTAEDYNQLTVNINDMHTKALGIDGIDISDREGAAEAIQTIKDAINQVSSTRGNLGAIQNRLEHTQNNLSVMTENITDAESTIRDTDIADEMTTYTKNNILLQSAQAMLAQANQMPQGVLQLLQ